MVKRTLALAALFIFPFAATAFDTRLLGELSLSDDTDGQDQQSFHAGYRRPLEPPGRNTHWTAWAGYRQLHSALGHERFGSLRAEAEAPLNKATHLRARINPLLGKAWSPVLGNIVAGWTPGEQWHFELSGERDLVDTVQAVREENLVDTLALSGDYRFWGPLTLILSGFIQDFRDGNERAGRAVRLDYASERWPGLGVQLRGRRIDSEQRGVGYFSPRRLEEYDVQARYSLPLFDDRWNLGLRASIGEQHIDGTRSATIYAAEITGRGWFSDHYGLEGRAGCSNTGGLSGDSAEGDYRYCSAVVTFVASW